MTKKIFCFWVLLFFSSCLLQAQVRNADFFVKYTFCYLKDTLVADSYSSKTTLFLYGDKSETIFCTQADYVNDSLSTAAFGDSNLSLIPDADKGKAFSDFMAKYRDRLKASWYPFQVRHYIAESVTHLSYSSTPWYYTTSEVPKLEWELSSDVDNLLGVEVMKATTQYAGRNYEAWFAPSIPISYSPHVFSGLPGLIMKVQDVDKKFVFEATEVNPASPRHFFRSLKGFKMDMARKDYIAKQHDDLKGAGFTESGIIGETNSEKLQSQMNKAKRNARKWYLLMELY